MNQDPTFGSNVAAGETPKLPPAPDWSNLDNPGSTEGIDTRSTNLPFEGVTPKIVEKMDELAASDPTIQAEIDSKVAALEATNEGTVEYDDRELTFDQAHALLVDLETADDPESWNRAEPLRKAMESKWPGVKF